MRRPTINTFCHIFSKKGVAILALEQALCPMTRLQQLEDDHNPDHDNLDDHDAYDGLGDNFDDLVMTCGTTTIPFLGGVGIVLHLNFVLIVIMIFRHLYSDTWSWSWS